MDIPREKLADLIKKGANLCRDSDCSECGYAYIDLSCRFYSIADYLIANGVTVQEPQKQESKGVEIDQFNKWIPASEPPVVYRDKYRQLIPFLVCTAGQEYSFKTFYDGKKWGARGQDVSVTHWMPLPKPPKGE